LNCDVGVVEGKELLAYAFPPPHPFGKERVLSFWEGIKGSNDNFKRIEPRKVDRQVIELFHNQELINYVELASNLGYGSLDNGDTPAFKGVYDAARYVVGSTIHAAESVVEGRVDHAFNPVGGLHHATRHSSAGFCVFNDIAILTEVLRKSFGIERILYVDIDVHHGDGVFYSYESDPNFFIFDVHEDGRYLYPGTGSPEETGTGRAAGTKVNVSLPPGSGDAAIRATIPNLQKLGIRADPEFIIFQCGADGLAGDPLANLSYSPKAHKMVTDSLHAIAHEFCKGRIVALGGGGYSPANCAAAWLAVLKSLQHLDEEGS
jgi:acetoin utilization protein AcuC